MRTENILLVLTVWTSLVIFTKSCFNELLEMKACYRICVENRREELETAVVNPLEGFTACLYPSGMTSTLRKIDFLGFHIVIF